MSATYKYDPKSLIADEFINDAEIQETLAYAEANKNNFELIDAILEKARPGNLTAAEHGTALTHREASVLLACEDPERIQKMFEIAGEIKQAYYGNRIVLFAPLYLSNYCVNGCLYCPYHLKNKTIPRKKLTQEEIRAEVIALQDMGHKRLAIESGEDPVNNPIEYILDCIKTIYSVHHKNGDIRRVNVNIAATTVENYRKLKEAGIGTYILFQETYHKKSYEHLHPTGPKHDYNYHTEAMDRAMDGGIDDVGLGVLFGLELYKYEFAGLIMHAEHLEAVAHDQRPQSEARGRHRSGRVRRRHRRRDLPQDHRLHPPGGALYRHDHLHPRGPERQGKGAADGHLADQRSFQDFRGRLYRGDPADRDRAVRRQRPEDA